MKYSKKDMCQRGPPSGEAKYNGKSPDTFRTRLGFQHNPMILGTLSPKLDFSDIVLIHEIPSWWL